MEDAAKHVVFEDSSTAASAEDLDERRPPSDPFEAAEDAAPLIPLLPLKRAILFLDWDDTLFPSSWLHQLRPDFEEDFALDLTEDEREQLEALDGCVRELLHECSRLGRIFIVTNAEAGWVEQTASRFLPRAYEWMLRKQVPIISARACYAGDGPPDLWKAHTFNLLVGSVVRRKFDERTHFVSVGDSECERRAMLTCREQYYPHGFFKSIKLLEAPDLSLLLQQQQFLCHHLSRVIATNDCLDLLIDPSI